MPNLASQMRVAFSSMAWNTGSSSPGELEMTLQHLRRRGLLLQRLGELARARLHRLEQPHVLDRDHRLVGEGRDQLDLPVGERPHRRAHQRRSPDRNSFSQQRDGENRAKPPSSDPRCTIFGIGENVGDVDGAPSSRRRPTAGRSREIGYRSHSPYSAKSRSRRQEVVRRRPDEDAVIRPRRAGQRIRRAYRAPPAGQKSSG